MYSILQKLRHRTMTNALFVRELARKRYAANADAAYTACFHSVGKHAK